MVPCGIGGVARSFASLTGHVSHGGELSAPQALHPGPLCPYGKACKSLEIFPIKPEVPLPHPLPFLPLTHHGSTVHSSRVWAGRCWRCCSWPLVAAVVSAVGPPGAGAPGPAQRRGEELLVSGRDIRLAFPASAGLPACGTGRAGRNEIPSGGANPGKS